MRDNKNNDYIYHALNYYLDENIDINNENKIDELTFKRIKKLINKNINTNRNRKRHKRLRSLGIIVFIITNIVLISTNGVQVYANIGKSIISSFAKLRGDVQEYDKYSTTINKSVTHNGIKFLVNEIISDGNSLVVSYSIISDKNLKDQIKDFNSIGVSTSINGKQFKSLSRDGKLVDENRYDWCEWINDSEEIIPKEDFYLDIAMEDIGSLKGNWNTRVKVDRDKIKEEIKEYSVNKNIKISGNDKLNVKKIATSPLSVGVKCVGNYNQYNYILLDDKGNQLKWKGTVYDGGNIAMEYSGLLNKDTKSLTFVPFKFNKKYKPKFNVYELDKLPIKIDQDKYGSIIVNNVEWIENDKIKISYEVNSKYPLTSSNVLVLLDSNNKEFDSDNLNNHQVSIDNQKNFEKIFSGLDKNKTYKIGSRDIFKDYLIEEENTFKLHLK